MESLLETRQVERPGLEVSGDWIGGRWRLDGMQRASVILGRVVSIPFRMQRQSDILDDMGVTWMAIRIRTWNGGARALSGLHASSGP